MSTLADTPGPPEPGSARRPGHPARDSTGATGPGIDVPVLVIQGDADQVLPVDKTGQRLPALIKDTQLIIIEGGPHAIPWTHAAQVSTALLDFIRS